MPLICWEKLSPQERKELEALALLEGISVSEESLSRLYQDCREYAVGNASCEDEKEAKRAVWGKNKASKG